MRYDDDYQHIQVMSTFAPILSASFS